MHRAQHLQAHEMSQCFMAFFFLVLYLQYMEVPGPGAELELQLLAYPTAVATPDPRCICDLRHSLWQHRILNPLNETRDRTQSLMILVRFLTH